MNPLALENTMQINRVTLSFSGRHANLEGPFQDNLFDTHLRPLRVGLVFCIVFFIGFGIYDAVQVPQKTAWLWTIRYAIFCPLMLLLFVFSFSSYFKRFNEPAITTMILLGGLSMVSMNLIAQTAQCYTYTNGMVQVLFFIHAVLKLRFIWRTPATWCLVALYAGLAWSTGITPINVLVTDLFNLVCINSIGMMAAYIIEYSARRNFYLARHLESKKRRLAIANEYLEKRVEKRTADLSRTNLLLKDEIHERKTAEGALRKSEKRFRRMVNNVPDYMCVHDLNGNILDTNRPMVIGLGYRSSELNQLNFRSLLIPEQRDGFDHYLKVIRRDGCALGKMTLLTKEDKQLQFEYSNTLAEHTSGQRVVYCLARDMTQHQHTQKALAESQASLKSVFEISAAGMIIVNAHNREVVDINPAAADMIGTIVNDLRAKKIDQLIHLNGENPDGASDITAPHPIECELITQQQTHIPILKTTKVTTLNGQTHWIVSFVNMQKIKEAEETKRTVEKRLNQAQHLQSIGTLAGGIAHDFNNILFGMMGFTELALDDAAEDSLQAVNLKEALRGGRRAKEMISQILTFSRQDHSEKQPLQPISLIKEALKLIRASIPTTIEIQSHYKDQKTWIDANPTQLHQVIMNLCTNAARSMDRGGGHLSLELDKETFTEETVTHQGTINEGDYVRIRIKDTGIGMTTGLIDQIFVPFFTTRPQGEGTGMGLSVTLGIVQSHGGVIRVQSQVGKGSCFDVLIPAISAAERAPKKSTAALPTGNEHILYVDDEKPLNIMMDRMLSNLGYEVTTCQYALKALELVKNNPKRFDLVITDLTMPKMTGTRLARELLAIRPDLAIMICTGYGDQITQNNIHALGIRELLFKPIQKHKIATAIRQALHPN